MTVYTKPGELEAVIEDHKERLKEAYERVVQDVKRIEGDRPTGPRIPPELDMTTAQFARVAGPKKRSSPQFEQIIINLLEATYLIRKRLEGRMYSSTKEPLFEGELGAIKDLKALIDRCMR